MRRIALAALVMLLPAGCAALIDWNALSSDGGVDGSVDSPSRPDGMAEARSGSEAGSIDAPGEADAGVSNPCAQVLCGYFCNGYYCGNSVQNGFAGGAPDTLYLCVDGSTAGQQVCSPDCVIGQTKHADSCDHCISYPDGTYCGSALGYTNSGYDNGFGTLLNVIFTCKGQISSAPEQPCDASAPVCVQNGNVAHCSRDGG